MARHNACSPWGRPLPPLWVRSFPDSHEQGFATMIAITLNLLAEEQQAQVERARDPIKLFIAVGLGVLTAAVAWGGALSAILSERQVELQGLEAQWKKMNDVGQGESDYQKDSDYAAGIVTMNHSRTVVAPQLAMVKDIIPSSVKLTHINFALATETTGG